MKRELYWGAATPSHTAVTAPCPARHRARSGRSHEQCVGGYAKFKSWLAAPLKSGEPFGVIHPVRCVPRTLPTEAGLPVRLPPCLPTARKGAWVDALTGNQARRVEIIDVIILWYSHTSGCRRPRKPGREPTLANREPSNIEARQMHEIRELRSTALELINNQPSTRRVRH